MTLLQLKYFVETGYIDSTQKAEKKLNISQSTISVAIRSFEKELGVVLFHRTAKGLSIMVPLITQSLQPAISPLRKVPVVLAIIGARILIPIHIEDAYSGKYDPTEYVAASKCSL